MCYVNADVAYFLTIRGPQVNECTYVNQDWTSNNCDIMSFQYKYFNSQARPAVVCQRIKPNKSSFDSGTEWTLYNATGICVSWENLKVRKTEMTKIQRFQIKWMKDKIF